VTATPLVWIAVALAGGVGAILRFELDGAVQGRLAGEFPFGTLAVNALGSFLLGLLHGAGVTGDQLLLAGVALLGSLTTFSTWMLETVRLAEDGDRSLALPNVAVSLAIGLAATALGWAIGATM